MRIDRTKLAAELARRDMTISDLAKKSNVSRITVSSIRSGKSCSTSTAQKIANALELQLEELL